jgi:hypothetical protein
LLKATNAGAEKETAISEKHSVRRIIGLIKTEAEIDGLKAVLV